MRYEPNDTPLHHISPLVKIIYSLLVSILIVILRSPSHLLILTIMTISIFLTTKPKPKQIKAVSLIIFTIAATTMISQAVFYYFEPKTVLFTLINKTVPIIGRLTGGIYIYKEGLSYGLVQSMRIIAAMFMASAIVVTTHPSDMILALNRLKLPKDFSFVISVGILFFQQLIDEVKRIILAMRLRGLKLKGMISRVLALKYIITPLIINSLRRAHLVAIASEIRGFSCIEDNDRKRFFSLKTIDLITISFFIVLLYVSILPFKMGLSKIPFIHTFFFSIPFTCILFIGIRAVPKRGAATMIICAHSLFVQLISRGINPLWWPYALIEAFTLEAYFLVTKNYIDSRFHAITAGALRGLVVYLYFYYISAPLIWHKFYAPWYIMIHTVQGAVGSAVGGLIGYQISKTVEKAYKYGGL